MSLQIIHGGNGKPMGVFIPMNDWEALKKEYQNLEQWEEQQTSKAQLLANLKDSFQEIKQIKAGKQDATMLKDFLNEL